MIVVVGEVRSTTVRFLGSVLGVRGSVDSLLPVLKPVVEVVKCGTEALRFSGCDEERRYVVCLTTGDLA